MRKLIEKKTLGIALGLFILLSGSFIPNVYANIKLPGKCSAESNCYTILADGTRFEYGKVTCTGETTCKSSYGVVTCDGISSFCGG